jgi:hypothetical protein
VLREPVAREPLLRELPELRELELRDEPRELPVLRDELERERVPPLERPLARELLDERRVVLRRLRVVLARCPRGTSARTTSFTRRASSASRNFAIRSSSRLIPFASCAVSLSPTASANVWMRE